MFLLLNDGPNWRLQSTVAVEVAWQQSHSIYTGRLASIYAATLCIPGSSWTPPADSSVGPEYCYRGLESITDLRWPSMPVS